MIYLERYITRLETHESDKFKNEYFIFLNEGFLFDDFFQCSSIAIFIYEIIVITSSKYFDKSYNKWALNLRQNLNFIKNQFI